MQSRKSEAGRTSRRWRAARSTARTAPPEASRFLLPPARRYRSSPNARRDDAPCYRLRARLDAGLGKVRRWAAPLMLGTLAACLRFRRQLGRCRRSALLNVGPRLAAGSPVATVEAAIAARFVPPVFSSSVLGGARVFSSLLFSASIAMK